MRIGQLNNGITDAYYILGLAEKITGWTVAELTGPSRTKELTEARHGTVAAIRELTCLSYPAIGEIFERDHSTIMEACRKVEGRQAEKIYKRLKSMVEIECLSDSIVFT